MDTLTWIVPAAVIAVLVAPGLFPVSDGKVAAFERSYALRTSDDVHGFVHRYLTTGNRLRRLAFVAALALPPLAGAVLGRGRHDVDVFSTPVLVALMAATLLAELVITRPIGPPGVRSASLRPRDPADYLPRSLLIGASLAGAAAAATWAGTLLFPDQPADLPDRWPNPTAVDVAAGIVVGVAVPVTIVVVARWIARRPQPFVDPGLVAADDAVRRASVRRIAALGCCIALLDLAGGAQRYAGAFNGPIDPAVAVVIGACVVLTGMAWLARGRAVPPASTVGAATDPATA
jgi:hypothetical protein